MHQFYKAGFIVFTLGLILGVSDWAHAKSWRNLTPIPAASIWWEKGFIGIVGQDKTRLYRLTGRGSLAIPFLGKTREPDGRGQYMSQWLARHPGARANKGLWEDAEYKRENPPGRIEYPGGETLARFELAAERTPDPPPVFDAKTPEGDLLKIADGDYSALTELIRRVESGTIPTRAFNHLIFKGLERQGDPTRRWRGLYGSLIELAFQQGRLSDHQVERYARQAILPVLDTSWVKTPNRPQPRLAIGGEIRVGQVKARAILKDNQAGTLLLTASYRLANVQIDGVPVNNFKSTGRGAKEWSRQLRGGNPFRQFHLEPGQTLAPGLHTLTGELEVRILAGIDAWNAAGSARNIPDAIKPLAVLRLEIDSLFNKVDGCNKNIQKNIFCALMSIFWSGDGPRLNRGPTVLCD